MLPVEHLVQQDVPLLVEGEADKGFLIHSCHVVTHAVELHGGTEEVQLAQDEHGNSTANLANIHILKFRAGDPGVCPLMFESKYVRFRDFPVIGEPMIVDSKMNADIKPNEDFDNPAKEMQVDNDGNPIFVNGGLPPIEDKTEPSYIPPANPPRMPPDEDMLF